MSAHRLSDDRGTTTVVAPLVIVVSSLLLVMLLNLVVANWAHGVVRSALDEGARAGATSGAGIADCEDRIDQALTQLLGDIATVTRNCTVDGDYVTATADVTIDGWLPTIPDRHFTIAARSLQEFEAE